MAQKAAGIKCTLRKRCQYTYVAVSIEHPRCSRPFEQLSLPQAAVGRGSTHPLACQSTQTQPSKSAGDAGQSCQMPDSALVVLPEAARTAQHAAPATGGRTGRRRLRGAAGSLAPRTPKSEMRPPAAQSAAPRSPGHRPRCPHTGRRSARRCGRNSRFGRPGPPPFHVALAHAATPGTCENSAPPTAPG